MIHYQAMKFASKGFNVEDLKDIYEDIPVRRTANKNNIPKSKVRLRTASTDESNYDNNSRFNNVRETNEKLTNAFFGISSNNNSDYLSDNYVG